jgi:selenoprotein W-related protein
MPAKPHPAKPHPAKPHVEITYCRLCGWGLRASWMAQEILATFAEEIGSVTLTPDASGGVFECAPTTR